MEFLPCAKSQDKDVHVSTNLNKSGMANRKDDDVNVCTYSSNMADRDKENVNVVQAPTKRKREETSDHSHCCVPESLNVPLTNDMTWKINYL